VHRCLIDALSFCLMIRSNAAGSSIEASNTAGVKLETIFDGHPTIVPGLRANDLCSIGTEARHMYGSLCFEGGLSAHEHHVPMETFV